MSLHYMKAIVISEFGDPSVLKIQQVPKPQPESGEVLIHVKAFGVNHAEMHMRKGEWDEWNPITGLECVGIVEACPNGEVEVGAKVIGVMGGIGRSRPGSYGEYVTVPSSNVTAIRTNLTWEDLAAIPEVYSTVYLCLFTVLDLQSGESLLIRGATSTLGQAALNLAAHAGARVTVTTRRPERFDMMKTMGAIDVVLEQEGLPTALPLGQKFDKVLNLVGNRVLVESINMTRAGGRIVQAGWLGGLAPVHEFNPMIQMESGVHFSLLHSKVLGSPEFPLQSIPLQKIVDDIEGGAWNAKPVKVFDYDNIRAAHELLDSHDAGGKIVVKH